MGRGRLARFDQDIQPLSHHKGPLALDPPCSGGPHFKTMIRFDQTPPPTVAWDRHLSTESRLMLQLRGGTPTVVQRDLGDENDHDDLNDGLEVME